MSASFFRNHSEPSCSKGWILNANPRINRYPADKREQYVLSYPPYRDLSNGWRYPLFEQPGPDVLLRNFVAKQHYDFGRPFFVKIVSSSLQSNTDHYRQNLLFI